MITVSIGAAPATESAIPAPPAGAGLATVTDHEVLDLVLGDLLSKASEESLVSAHGGPPGRLTISSRSATQPITMENVLYRHEREPWRNLTEASLPQLREAAASLVSRVESGGFSGFQSSDLRVSVREPLDHQAESPEALFDRPIEAWPPGYSSDGVLAVVCLSIPWSIHSSTATYVLVKSSRRWTIVVRQFVYYP